MADDLVSLVLGRGLDPEKVVVEHNYSVVPREQWGDIVLSDGDNVEIVAFVGGG